MGDREKPLDTEGLENIMEPTYRPNPFDVDSLKEGDVNGDEPEKGGRTEEEKQVETKEDTEEEEHLKGEDTKEEKPQEEGEEDIEGDADGDRKPQEGASEDNTITMTAEEHAALLEQIEILSGNKLEDVKDKPPKVKEGEEEKVDAPSLDLPEGGVFFESEEDLDEMLTDVNKANEFFGNVLAKGQEQVLRALPQLVTKMIEKRAVLQEEALSFYKENEDLRPYGKFVGLVTTELAAEDPTKSIDNLLKDVAVEVRKRLKMKKKAVRKKNSALVDKKSNVRRSGGRLTDLEKEVADLMI